MAPASIPGFYYDESKEKYFKIQSNHIAPINSQYSKEYITKEAEEMLAAKRRRAFEDLKRKQRLQRSKILEHPLGGRAALQRESGAHYDSLHTMNEAWAHGLSTRVILQCRNERDVGEFVYDEATGSFIYTQRQEFSTTAYETMTTSMGGRERAEVHLTRLVDPASISREFHIIEPVYAGFIHRQPILTSDSSLTLRATSSQTFWASSARPDSTRSDFALATSVGTFLVAENQAAWDIANSQSFKPISSKNTDLEAEILAVDWLDTNVTLNGCRRGKIRLWDVRTSGIEGTSLPLKHPSAVNHVRKVKENVIIVAGLKDQLCTYDLRFLTKSKISGPTKPYVAFPTYENKAHNGLALGFDVCGGIVAAAPDRHRVALFDVATGRELLEGPGGPMGYRDFSGPSKCVRLIGGEESRHGMRLMVANGEAIDEWAWGDENPKHEYNKFIG